MEVHPTHLVLKDICPMFYEISDVEEYELFLEMITQGNGATTLDQRKYLATRAFHVSSNYDTAIFNYFNILAILKPYFLQKKPQNHKCQLFDF